MRITKNNITFKSHKYNERYKIPVGVKNWNPAKPPFIKYKLSRKRVNKRAYCRKIFHRIKVQDWIKKKLNKMSKKTRINPISYGEIRIVFQRRNTFCNLSRPVRYNIKTGQLQHHIIGTLSSGLLGYNGKKKSSPFVKEQIGEQLANFATQSNIRLCKIIFVKKIGRVYKQVLKGIARSQLWVKSLLVWHVHPHGAVRAPKKRRV